MLRRLLGLDLKLLNPGASGIQLFAARNESRSRERAKKSEGQVVRQVAIEQQAFLLAVFAQQAHALAETLAWAPGSAQNTSMVRLP